MDRIKDSGSFGRGSNPLGGTGQRHSTSERLFFVIDVKVSFFAQGENPVFRITKKVCAFE